MLIWSRQIKHEWIRGRWREMKFKKIIDRYDHYVRCTVRIQTRKCTNGLKRGRSDANKRQTVRRRGMTHWSLHSYCKCEGVCRTFFENNHWVGCLEEVLRKNKSKIIIDFIGTEQSIISLYVCFTKQFDQVILMYKIGNTRIEFQTSSRIKLQLAGSINESRPFTSLSRRFQRKSDT